MKAMMTALGSTDPATIAPKASVEAAVRALTIYAIGDVPGVDVEAVRRLIGHVWFSSTMRWVSGQAPTGSVGQELAFTARLLLGLPRVHVPDSDLPAPGQSSRSASSRKRVGHRGTIAHHHPHP